MKEIYSFNISLTIEKLICFFFFFYSFSESYLRDEAAQRPPGGALYKPDDAIKECKQDVSKSFFTWKALFFISQTSSWHCLPGI